MSIAGKGGQPPAGVAVLDVPSTLGLRPLHAGHVPGAWRLSTALRANGLMSLAGLVDEGVVPVPAYAPAPAFGFRQGEALRDYSLRLADRLGEVLERHRFTLLLGGDCSILVGSGLALKERGRFGLVFIDGHTDYAYPSQPEGLAGRGFTAAGLDLGLATGHGPAELVNLRGMAPYFDEANVVAFGYRMIGNPEHYDLRDWERSPMLKLPLDRIREIGIQAAVTQAVQRLASCGLDGIWIHLDADVLDPRIMPAVDSPEDEGGMTFEELEAALSLLLCSPDVIGLEFTIFDPDRDPDGALACRWVDFLAKTLPLQPAVAGRFGAPSKQR